MSKGFWLRAVAITGTALWLTACVQTPKPPVTTPVTPPVTVPGPSVDPLPYIPADQRLSALPGWETSDAFIALEAVRGTCNYRSGRQYAAICADLAVTDFESPEEIKSWLLARFKIERVEGEGLLTAYFVPEYPAVSVPDQEFSQPVRVRPADLEMVDGAMMSPPQTAGVLVAARRDNGRYVPYYSRAEIETRPATGASLYMRPEDYFFMQIQGSGFLTLPDGTRVLAAYAANNGLPFVGIARPMTERGILTADQSSGENIRKWLAANRGPVAQEMMNQNPRYAFFTIDTTRMEPLGAASVPLPAGSAIAVDPAHHVYGDLYWIDADAGALKNAFPSYQRMVAALDTGGAIKGKVRADLYMGIGDRAGLEAGRVKHNLRKWRIVPAR
ncbi:MAG: MltA domain-containing protein [Asticcacaulis sp.]